MKRIRNLSRYFAYRVYDFIHRKFPGMHARELGRIRLVTSAPPLVRLSDFNGAKFAFPVPTRGVIEDTILATGTWSGNLLLLSDFFIRPGSTVIEVGANIGYECSYFSAKYPNCEIHAFEPANYGYENILISRAYNKFKNLHAHRVGLGDQNGSLSLSVPTAASQNKGLGSFHKNSDIDATYATEEVPVVRLDDYLILTQPLSLLKIDTQGYELPVLVGAEGIIKKYLPVIIFEFEDHYHENPQNIRNLIADFLESKGYRTFLTSNLNLYPTNLRIEKNIHNDIIALPATMSKS
jgi:FkbM family methyltransferase